LGLGLDFSFSYIYFLSTKPFAATILWQQNRHWPHWLFNARYWFLWLRWRHFISATKIHYWRISVFYREPFCV